MPDDRLLSRQVALLIYRGLLIVFSLKKRLCRSSGLRRASAFELGKHYLIYDYRTEAISISVKKGYEKSTGSVSAAIRP